MIERTEPMIKFGVQSPSSGDSKVLCNENKEGRNLNCPPDISGRHTYDDSLECGEKILEFTSFKKKTSIPGLF